jgi:hypothetical protein
MSPDITRQLAARTSAEVLAERRLEHLNEIDAVLATLDMRTRMDSLPDRVRMFVAELLKARARIADLEAQLAEVRP